MQWRLLLPETNLEALEGWRSQGRAAEAGWNMALDEVLLEQVSQNSCLPVFRLYLWNRPAITLGRFQNADRTLDVSACAEQGIPLVRRITGGRGILHGDDLTVSLILPVALLGLGEGEACSIAAIYSRLAPIYLRALAVIGMEAVVGACVRETAAEARGNGNCFAAVSRADVIDSHTGTKLIGSALYRRDRWILQQASIPLNTPSQRETIRNLRSSVFRGIVPETTVPKNLEYHFAIGELCEALVTEMRRQFDCSLPPDSLTHLERQTTQKRAEERFQPL